MKKLFRPWPRWAKIARNLTVTAMLALFIWMCLGAPLTLRGELRRFERQCLLPPGEIVLDSSVDERFRSPFFVSVSDAAVVTVGNYSQWMDPLTGDGPELFPLRTVMMWVSNGRYHSAFAYILAHPPEKAARAVLAVTNRVSTYTAEGTFTDGAVLFIMPSPRGDDTSSVDWWEPERCTWEITYFDAQGNPFEM